MDRTEQVVRLLRFASRSTTFAAFGPTNLLLSFLPVSLSRLYIRRNTPTTTPSSIVGLKSAART
jgi:hypothetical protein